MIYSQSMGVLLWQKHLCSELIGSPMRFEVFSVHRCSGRQSLGVGSSGVTHAGVNKAHHSSKTDINCLLCYDVETWKCIVSLNLKV